MAKSENQEKKEPSLKDKREAFVLAYIGEARFNATDAARRAGYAHPEVEGSRLLRNDRIRARIDDHMKAATLNAHEVLAELSVVASGPFSDFITVIARDKTGTPVKTRFDLSSKVKALELLGKHYQLFVDRLHHTGDITFADLFAIAEAEAGEGDSPEVE